MKRFFVILFILGLLTLPIEILGQGPPVYPASDAQIAAGLVGQPFYVTPRGLSHGGFTNVPRLVSMNWRWTDDTQSWPTNWVSAKGNVFEIPISSVTNLMVSGGSFGIQTNVTTWSPTGTSNAENLVFACINAAEFTRIGCDIYCDSFTYQPIYTNYPSWEVTFVVSPYQMISNNIENLNVPKWLHIQINYDVGNNQLVGSVAYNTNGLITMVGYQTNISAPYPLLNSFASWPYTTNATTAHNYEVRYYWPCTIALALDGTVFFTCTDTNAPSFWGTFCWWETGCATAGTGPASSDTTRVRFRDVYTYEGPMRAPVLVPGHRGPVLPLWRHDQHGL